MKWLIALCLLLVALFLGVRSLQDSSLNQQLYERQRELGYATKKRPFWIGKRIVSVLFVAAAAVAVMPTAEQDVNNKLEPSPMSVMHEEESAKEKSRTVMMDALPSITLNFSVNLSEKQFEIDDQKLLGFYEVDGKSYNVYIIDNELIFQDQAGNTYINQSE